MRKRWTNAAEPYAGRGDLLFTLPKDQRFVAEAKWSCPSPNSGSMVQTVRDALGAAQRDLAMVQGYGDYRRLSLVFVAPRFGVRRFRNKPAVIEQALDEMLRELWQDQHLSLVWTFPREAVTPFYIYPGACLCLSEQRGS